MNRWILLALILGVATSLFLSGTTSADGPRPVRAIMDPSAPALICTSASGQATDCPIPGLTKLNYLQGLKLQSPSQMHWISPTGARCSDYPDALYYGYSAVARYCWGGDNKPCWAIYLMSYRVWASPAYTLLQCFVSFN